MGKLKMKDPMAGLLAPVTKIFNSTICSLKLVGNFQKCVGFYALDVLKYLICFWPILLGSVVTRTSITRNTEWVNNQTRWSDTTMNQCYLCKNKNNKNNNKKKNKKNGIRNKNGEFGKNGKNGSGNGFFYFLSGAIIIFFLFQLIYYYSSPNISHH